MSRCRCHSHGGFLTRRGYAEVEQRSLEGLEVRRVDKSRVQCYLDSQGSVSGSPESILTLDDAGLDEQYRRFHNGS